MVKILAYKSKTGSTKYYHAIYAENPHPKSYTSFVLLQDRLQKLDIDFIQEEALKNKYSFVQRILFSRAYLNKVLVEKGDLCCTYCAKNKLIIEEAGMNVPANIKATIDHVVPISKDGAIFDTENVVVACGRCNRKKDNMSLEDFLKRYMLVLNLKPNFEILNKHL